MTNMKNCPLCGETGVIATIKETDKSNYYKCDIHKVFVVDKNVEDRLISSVIDRAKISEEAEVAPDGKILYIYMKNNCIHTRVEDGLI